MNANNVCTLTGRLGSNPNVRGDRDRPVVSGLIICDDGYYDEHDQWVENASAVPFVAFGPAAKRMKSLGATKGDELTLVGKVQSGSYEKSGETRRTLELQVISPGNVMMRRRPEANIQDKSSAKSASSKTSTSAKASAGIKEPA